MNASTCLVRARPRLALVLVLLAVSAPARAQARQGAAASAAASTDSGLTASVVGGLRFRAIGPALTSGRIGDIAVHPTDKSIRYVAVASGGVWKTVNAGTTWTPIFDGEGSYSIGCITLDPKNPNVVWVGTGENNSQRSVAYGDGVYKSEDGGRTWRNVGLKESEHIGRIVIDPRDSDVVYATAQGPLWRRGGDRGVFKTTDGGATWKKILDGGDWSGANDILLDPRDPDVLLASMWQRHRRVWTMVSGGPESGLHKSTDGGATWKKSQSGLPSEDLGRIGLTQSPVNPDVVYAIIDAANNRGGFYRSRDGGSNWERMNSYQSGGNYYNEIFADPKNVDRVYSMDVFNMVTNDGGRTFVRLGERLKHVDNHVICVDPDDTGHMLIGSDGGLYESWDAGATYHFFANLPVTQFYKVTVDNALPFYNIYGGTQDNFSLGGPSRTRTNHGIRNSDWFVTAGGDGFQTVVDPNDPNIVYSQSQHGNLQRFNLKTGESINIQPQEDAGEPGLKWNWDSPLIVSPHLGTRLYFAANRVYRTDDRGNSWRAVSPDLTRGIDRNRLRIMGRVWSADAVGKNQSTSIYGNIVALGESPLKEGMLYAGTDDGLIHVTEDGGGTWRRMDRFPGVPDTTYVSRVTPSQHAVNTVYAAFDNHKSGDFKPYVLKSTDAGRSWTSIASNLPARGSVYVVIEDHVDPNLLFAGTEFGVFFTNDGGRKWVRLRGGIPTIMVRDLAIQKRENDLVAATFGRGFYVLDDYSPLRSITARTLAAEATLFPVKKAPMFVTSSPLGLPGASFQGASFFTAPNPPGGAIFTYYLKDELKTRRARRHDAEKEAAKKNADVFYPAWPEFKSEDREEAPAILLTVSDADGRVVRRLTGPVTAGFQRVDWDLRYPPPNPTSLATPSDDNPFNNPPVGPMIVPGTYRVALAKRVDGVVTALGEPQTFVASPLDSGATPRSPAVLAFAQQTARLQRAMLGASAAANEAMNRVQLLKRAIQETPTAPDQLATDVRAVETRLRDVQEQLTGDPTVARRGEATPPSLLGRVGGIVGSYWSSTMEDATQTSRRQYEIAAAEFGGVLERLRTVLETDLKRVEDAAEAAGAPWTSGRLPRWQP